MEIADQAVSPVELERLSLDRLQRLQTELEAAIGRKQEVRKANALAEIKRLVTEAELTAEAVIQHLKGKPGRKRTGAKVPPKFRDPEHPENSWAGRGKKPRWLEERLAAGASLEDFRIPATEQSP